MASVLDAKDVQLLHIVQNHAEIKHGVSIMNGNV